MTGRLRRNWEKYHRKNNSGSECQLVAALNACYYLTGRYIDQNSDEYEELVDLCGAWYGSAISIGKVWKKLGIKIKKTYLGLLDSEDNLIKKKKSLLPLEMIVWHKIYGFHSVSAVDYEPRTDSFRIPNFKYVTNIEGWIFYEDLFHFIKENPDKTKPRYRYRQFGLIESRIN